MPPPPPPPKEIKYYTHHLDKNMKWLARPGEKCSGDYYVNKVKLLVNWFRFTQKIYDREYYEYAVEMYKMVERGRNRKTNAILTKRAEIPIPERSELFWKHLQFQKRQADFHIEDYVFDDKDVAYSIHKNTERIFSEMKDPKNPKTTYFLEIRYRDAFKLYFSREDPMRDEEANRSCKFMKSVMTQKVRCSPFVNQEIGFEFAKNFLYDGNSILRIPESFHDPSRFDHSLEIAPRIEAWFGIYIGVKELFTGEPVLNFAIVDKLFYNAPLMSLLDYILLIVDPETYRDEHRKIRKQLLKTQGLTINASSAARMEQVLSDLKLKATDVWNPKASKFTERHLTFTGLSPYNSIELEIEVQERRGRDVAIHNVPLIRIYENNRKPIEFPKLPVVICKSGSNSYLVPMEHLFVHEKGQRYKNRIDFAMQEKFIKAATRKPHIYKEQTIDMLKDLNFSSEELNFVERFGLCSELKMIQCDGKVLKEPNLVNKENEKIKMTPVVRGFQEKALNVVPEKELCCAIFVVRDEGEKQLFDEEDVSTFYKNLIDGCEFRGIRIGTHPSRQARSLLCEVNQDDPNKVKFGFYKDVTQYSGFGNFRNAANDALAMFNRLPDKDNKILLFIVISDRRLNAYGFIKQFCDVDLGVASQHIEAKTVRRALLDITQGCSSKRLFYQIALKINGKLGGVNQELDWSESVEMSVEEKEERKKMPLRMYVGIDVTHPTNGSGIDFSIAAIVASINPSGTVYRNMVVTQEESRPGERPMAHGKERTDILEGKFVQLLRMFAENNDNRIPAHIVIYRDGVSDSEMLRVSHDELRSLKAEVSAFLKERGGNEAEPKYTFIVLQKRHKTRLHRVVDKKRPDDKEPELQKLWDDDMKESANTGFVNPSSGTTVDKDIVSKYKFDFFLASHHGALGTSRPGHYTVMYDNMPMTKDNLYKMTYELAFLSARCRKPISIPAPVHYAHLSCEKAKELYRSFKRDKLGLLPRPPKRQEIEEYLQTNRAYPGMSFA